LGRCRRTAGAAAGAGTVQRALCGDRQTRPLAAAEEPRLAPCMTARGGRRRHVAAGLFVVFHPSRPPTRAPATASASVSTCSIRLQSPRSLPTSRKFILSRTLPTMRYARRMPATAKTPPIWCPAHLMQVGKPRGAYSCVSYQSAADRKQYSTVGWVRSTSLTPVLPTPSPSRADWIGAWIRAGGKITIKKGPRDRLRIGGEPISRRRERSRRRHSRHGRARKRDSPIRRRW